MSLSDISINFTEKSLDEIIRKVGGIKHTSFNFGSDDNKKGDSYLSTIYKLQVCGIDANDEHVEINLIVKSMPKNLSRRKLFRSADFFRNEVNFYTKVLPALEEFQKKKAPSKPFEEYPRCLLAETDGENDFVALENVNFLGYMSPNRQNYVELEDCCLIMRSLGRFHGLSLACRDQDPVAFENVINSTEEVYYAERLRSWYANLLKDAITVAKDAVSKTYPGSNYEKLAIAYLSSNLYDDMIQLTSTRSKYSVIGHGDCWFPNFLIQSSNGVSTAVKIIDFQLARYASFALDFTFFLYSCTSQALRESHYETILKEYHSSAYELIRDLGSDPEKVFPYSGMLEDLKEFGRFGCGMGIESLPMSMMEDDDVSDLDALTSENPVLTDVWKIFPFKAEEKRVRIAEMFKHAIDSGYITGN